MSKQKGFSAIEGLLIFFVVTVVGFGGWYVLNQNQDTAENAKNNSKNSPDKELPINTVYDGFSVENEPYTLRGSCDDGAVLFAPIYNADNYDYDCLDDIKYRFGYALVFFGKHPTSIANELDSEQRIKPKTVTLASGASVQKYSMAVTEQVKTHSDPPYEDKVNHYHVYEARAADGGVFYAVEKNTAEQASDDFEGTVQNNWILQ